MEDAPSVSNTAKTTRYIRLRPVKKSSCVAARLNSPQLLLLSGIGPAKQLQALDLPVIVDLPGVGQNLQDHLDVAVAYECTEPISLSTSQAAAEIEYRYFRKGPWSSNGGEAGGFLKTKADLPMPDLQFHFSPGWSVGFGVTRPTGHGFTFWPALLLPKSRGYVELRSPNPLEVPLIQPNYLAHEADIEVLVKGIEIARKLAKTKAFAPLALGPLSWIRDRQENQCGCIEFSKSHPRKGAEQERPKPQQG